MRDRGYFIAGLAKTRILCSRSWYCGMTLDRTRLLGIIYGHARCLIPRACTVRKGFLNVGVTATAREPQTFHSGGLLLEEETQNSHDLVVVVFFVDLWKE
jgi:hypothetical protein